MTRSPPAATAARRWSCWSKTAIISRASGLIITAATAIRTWYGRRTSLTCSVRSSSSTPPAFRPASRRWARLQSAEQITFEFSALRLGGGCQVPVLEPAVAPDRALENRVEWRLRCVLLEGRQLYIEHRRNID